MSIRDFIKDVIRRSLNNYNTKILQFINDGLESTYKKPQSGIPISDTDAYIQEGVSKSYEAYTAITTANADPIGITCEGVAEININPNGRAIKQIPFNGIPEGYSFGAYRSIALNSSLDDSESFKLCAIQFFGTTNQGKSANIAIKSFSNTTAQLSVKVQALFIRDKLFG